jgi:small subunit ribosomal protein S4
LYGVLEKQFRIYFKKAKVKQGGTGHNLIIMLESRLDNTVYRLGLAPTRRSARQLVNHKHFMVNNRVVNIPSFQMKEGDVVQVRDKSKKNELFHNSMRMIQGDNPTSWLTLDKAKLKGSFDHVPERADIPEIFNEQLVVELYSK